MLKKLLLLLFIMLVLITTLLHANELDEEIDTLSTFGVNNGYDESGNHDFGFVVDWQLPSYQHIFINYGKSNSSDSLLNTIQYTFGLSTNRYEAFSLGAEYSYWGKYGALETRTLKTPMTINRENWSFELAPQLIIATIFLDPDLISASRQQSDAIQLAIRAIKEISIEQYDVKGFGNQIRLSYFGLDNYSFSASYYISRFGPTPLDNTSAGLKGLIDRTIPITATSLAQSLEKERRQLSVDRFFNWGSLGFNWSRSEFAIVDGTASNIAFNMNFEITEALFVGIDLGRQTYSEDDSISTYMRTSLFISW